MITVIVQFKLPQPLTTAQARQVFLSTAPRYQGLAGLIRKYYVLSEDGGTAGGVYLWRSRADAQAFYTPQWKDFVRDKYGTAPQLSYLECPVVVDNTTHELVCDAP
jgi:hypothetical protein